MHRGRRFRARRLLGRNVSHGQHDATVDRVDLEDPHVEVHPLVRDVRRVGNRAHRRQLAHRNEALDVVADVDDHALVHQPHDLATQLRAHRVRLTDTEPRIFLRLLEAERDPLVVRVDVQDHDVDRIALLHDFRRMLHALRPAHVGDVNEAVDAGLDLDERAEAREVPDLAVDARAHRVLERQHHPRILLRLLHAERDLLLVRVDLEHHGLDRLADRHELRRVTNVARPAHLADVDEPFDARLELDERAVVGDGDDLAGDARTHRVLRRDVLPRVRLELLEAERDALTLPIDVENLDLQLAPDLHHLRGVRDAPPRHVGDVQQAVDATEIDERTEVGDVLDHALPDLVLLEFLHQLLALAGPLGLEDHSTRDDDVAATLVQLDDLELVLLPEKLVDVRHAPQRDLRAGEERVDAHEVDDDTTLDLLDERTFDGLIVFVGEADALPDAHEVRLLFRQNNRAFLVLEVLQQHLDFIAGFDVGKVLELLERDRPFGFETDVEDDHVVADFEHLGLDNFTLFNGSEGAIVHVHHLLVLLGGVLVFLVELGTAVGKRPQLRLLQVALLARGEHVAGG